MTTRRKRAHPARRARRNTGAAIAASTLALVGVMGLQSTLESLASTTADEGTSALQAAASTPSSWADGSSHGS
jgi:hypothetical protein